MEDNIKDCFEIIRKNRIALEPFFEYNENEKELKNKIMKLFGDVDTQVYLDSIQASSIIICQKMTEMSLNTKKIEDYAKMLEDEELKASYKKNIFEIYKILNEEHFLSLDVYQKDELILKIRTKIEEYIIAHLYLYAPIIKLKLSLGNIDFTPTEIYSMLDCLFLALTEEMFLEYENNV